MDIKKLLETLTIEQKASLLSGASMMKTKEIPELGIEAFRMSDGPNGVRRLDPNDNGDFGVSDPLPSTAFPTGSTLAMSWNKELLNQVGKAIARECKFFDVDAILGPSMNIKKNPLCGRNFEYYSEDPFLTSRLAVNYVLGVRSENVIATPKHFACNNNEKWRYVGDSIVDERALREIYTRAFMDVVKEAKPGMIMTAYNSINGQFASENSHLQLDILRKDWGFEGISVTDWGGLLDRERALVRGTDLEMPGCVQENIDQIVEAYNAGRISLEMIDASVKRILEAIEQTHKNKKPGEEIFEENDQLAEVASLESIVLLKNDNILPLSKEKKYLCIGKYFKEPRYQGGGSSLLNPYYFTTPKEAFEEYGVNYRSELGYDDYDEIIKEELEYYALEDAQDYDAILYFVGQSDFFESEGFDRPHMRLPDNQLHLLKKIMKTGKPVVLILFGGSQVELENIDEVSGLVYVGLPGQEGGRALYKVLFGEVAPSGRMMETWAYHYEDHPTSKVFIKTPIEVYKESIYVGYRYFDAMDKRVRYPFGYGLSYTNFIYKNLKVEVKKDSLLVSFIIKNDGDMDAKDVPQIYIGKTASSTFRAKKELKGFEKVLVKAHEEKEVTIEIPLKQLEIFDINLDRFVLEDGEYIVYLAKNVNEVVESTKIDIKGEKLPKEVNPLLDVYYQHDKLDQIKNENFAALLGREVPVFKGYKKPYDREVPMCMMKGFFSSILKNQARAAGYKMLNKGFNLPEGRKRQRYLVTGNMIEKSVSSNCVRSIVNSSAGAMPPLGGEGMLDIANGHPIKGLKKFNASKKF